MHNSHQLSKYDKKELHKLAKIIVMLKFNSDNWGLTFNSGSLVLGNDREDTNKETMKEQD